jgi:hypothetical protein
MIALGRFIYIGDVLFLVGPTYCFFNSSLSGLLFSP